MIDVMAARTRKTLTSILTAAAPQWNVDPTKVKFLSDSPLATTDLPAISVSFPAVRVRPVGLGNLAGQQGTNAGPLRTLVGLRLEGQVRFDIWVARDANAALSLDQIQSLSRFVSESLQTLDRQLRAVGVLRFKWDATGDVIAAESLPGWLIRGQGFTRQLIGDLLFEATFPSEEVESLIAAVNVTVNGPDSATRFSVR